MTTANQAVKAGAIAASSIEVNDERVLDRVYLSGPMTGIEDFNYPAFNAEAARLRGMGQHVENPAEAALMAGAEWADYMRYDIPRLTSCQRIRLLPGWSSSRGAKLELVIAKALGMAIEYADGAERDRPEPANQRAMPGRICGGDACLNTVNVSLIGRVPWGDLPIGTEVTVAVRLTAPTNRPALIRAGDGPDSAADLTAGLFGSDEQPC